MIDTNGKINLPYVGDLRLAGKTEGAAADAIVRAYHDANLISDAQASVVRDPSSGGLKGP